MCIDALAAWVGLINGKRGPLSIQGRHCLYRCGADGAACFCSRCPRSGSTRKVKVCSTHRATCIRGVHGSCACCVLASTPTDSRLPDQALGIPARLRPLPRQLDLIALPLWAQPALAESQKSELTCGETAGGRRLGTLILRPAELTLRSVFGRHQGVVSNWRPTVWLTGVLQSLQQFHISGRFRTSAPGGLCPGRSYSGTF